MTTDELIAKIKDKDANVRCAAWQAAGKVGAGAVGPLAAVMGQGGVELEVSRAAKNGLWAVVRHAGRPGAGGEKKAVVAKLIALLGGAGPTAVRREALWMLSELAGDEAVGPVAKLLRHKELREDACMSLERIGGEASLAALRAALASAPDGFKHNIAQSLRARGVKLDEKKYPCMKLVPIKKTSVKPV